jgi:multidrug transporter EmrE-like cation transporter
MNKYIPFILFTVLTNAAAQIMLKKGVMALGSFEISSAGITSIPLQTLFNPFIVLGLCIFMISTISHMLVLSRVELSFAYPFLSLAYVVVTGYAYFLFKEDVNAYRIVGIALICWGTLLVSRS